MKFSFDNSYANQLEGFYADSQPDRASKPKLVYFNHTLARQLGLNTEDNNNDTLAQLLSGNALPDNAHPIAQTYAGHQFGQFNPQLGDGRALIIGEHLDNNNNRFDIAFKGSGRTPYSRGGDGKAGLAQMLREVLIAEAMHALDIPTTRSLAVVSTGDSVHRDQLIPGAILTRVAASHIRIGTFQFFAARKQHNDVRKLADYSIARHYTGLMRPDLINDDQRYVKFLRGVIKRQASLIAKWMGVGFIHGVMNTDNMTIAGETIDYGPCAFMEAYDPNSVFSSIDHQGRYAYQNQPTIAQWNLARFAETLLPLINTNTEEAVEIATEELNAFSVHYDRHWLSIMRKKLGITTTDIDNQTETDRELITSWLTLLETNKVDFTLAFHRLTQIVKNNAAEDLTQENAETALLTALFEQQDEIQNWLQQWYKRLTPDASSTKEYTDSAKIMCANNPWIIPRNHRVEEALLKANESNDLTYFTNLLTALQNPFTVQQSLQALAEPASIAFTDRYQTFCGT